MPEITTTENRLRTAIATAINEVRGAGVTFQQYAGPIADAVLAELAKPSEEQLLEMARDVLTWSSESSEVFIMAKAYIAKCGEQPAKFNPMLSEDDAWTVEFAQWIVARVKQDDANTTTFEIRARKVAESFLALCEGLGVQLKIKKDNDQ